MNPIEPDATKRAMDGLPPLRQVIETHGIAAKKALGQNFLLDLNLTGKVARAAGQVRDKTFIEIGPGPGGLTRALLHNGARRVIAIERDERCRPALEDIAAAWPGRLEVHFGDATEIDAAALLADGETASIAANLPYNVGTVLLTGWLEADPWPPVFESMTLMFQREVAERIVAAPGTRHYGRLAVLAQWRCDCEIAFDIAPQAFWPPPKVTSSVVHLRPKVPVHDARLERLSTVTRYAFGQRRKMLRQALKPIGGEALLAKAGIDPTLRAETLEIAEFCALANALG